MLCYRAAEDREAAASFPQPSVPGPGVADGARSSLQRYRDTVKVTLVLSTPLSSHISRPPAYYAARMVKPGRVGSQLCVDFVSKNERELNANCVTQAAPPATFLGRVASQLLRLSDPGRTSYRAAACSWADTSGAKTLSIATFRCGGFCETLLILCLSSRRC